MKRLLYEKYKLLALNKGGNSERYITINKLGKNKN